MTTVSEDVGRTFAGKKNIKIVGHLIVHFIITLKHTSAQVWHSRGCLNPTPFAGEVFSPILSAVSSVAGIFARTAIFMPIHDNFFFEKAVEIVLLANRVKWLVVQ
jgi:hypothetical protein